MLVARIERSPLRAMQYAKILFNQLAVHQPWMERCVKLTAFLSYTPFMSSGQLNSQLGPETCLVQSHADVMHEYYHRYDAYCIDSLPEPRLAAMAIRVLRAIIEE